MFLIKYHKKQRIRGLVESSLALHIRLVDLFGFGFGWFRHQDIFMYVWSGDDFAIARRQIFWCIVVHENVSDITDTVLGFVMAHTSIGWRT